MLGIKLDENLLELRKIMKEISFTDFNANRFIGIFLVIEGLFDIYWLKIV